MRLSVLQGDPGHLLYEAMGYLGREVRIKLDGEEITGVLTADEEQGLIVRPKRDELHLLISKNGEIVLEEVRGKVEIIAPAGYRN